MQTETSQKTIVKITKAELGAWIAANMGKLVPADCMLRRPGQGPRAGVSTVPNAVMEMVFPVSADQLDAFLRTEVVGLPALGKYSFAFVDYDPVVGATVSWSA